MDWQATELNSAWRYAFLGLIRKLPAFSDAAFIAVSIRDWNRAMTLLDRQLAKSGDFVLGHQFTLADVVVGLSTHRWFSTPIERPNLLHVERYYEQLSQRPGFVQHGRNGIP